MRKPLLIGNNVFLTKKEALGHYKAILNSYHFGESLSDKDYEEIYGLIQYDESFSEEECGNSENNFENEDDSRSKIEEEQEGKAPEEDIFIEDIKVSKAQFNTKCFEIFLSDASSYYISYILIINQHKINIDTVFNKACRNAVQQDIKTIKQAYFDKNSVKGYVKCQESNHLSRWEELVIDHRQPNTFSVIVDRFKEIYRIDASKIDYITDEKNNVIFEDKGLAEKFRIYHKEKSNL